jgi:hypothetical protein
MDQRFLHGDLEPLSLANALLAEFNRGNFRAQILQHEDNVSVQIGTRPGTGSGGETAITVTFQEAPDGIMVRLGQQDWLSTAASLGRTAAVTLLNPWNLVSRLDDLAQDVANLQLSERVWDAIGRAARAAGASHELSARLRRLNCAYCGVANPVGQPTCIACGAPLGDAQPTTCAVCGFVVAAGESKCPNCGSPLQRTT